MLTTNSSIRSRLEAGIATDFLKQFFEDDTTYYASRYSEVGSYEKSEGKPTNIASRHGVVRAAIYVDNSEINIPVLSIAGMKIIRNYVKNYSDIILATFKVSTDDYINYLYPNKERLLVYINEQYIDLRTSQVKKDINPYPTMYKMILISNENLQVNESTFNKEINRDEPIDIKVQLILRSVELLRNKFVQGCYNFDVNGNSRYNLDDLLLTIIGKELKRVTRNNYEFVSRLEIVRPLNNKAPIENLVFPDKLKLVDVVDYIQKHAGGIYSEGAGFYIQAGENTVVATSSEIATIYPLYRATKDYFEKDSEVKYKADILVTNSQDIISETSTRYSYDPTDRVVKILAYSNMSSSNYTTEEELNNCNGFIKLDSRNFAYSNMVGTVGKKITTIANKPFRMEADKDGASIRMKSTAEYTQAYIIKNREDGVDYLDVSSDHVKNVFERMSDLIKARSSIIKLSWPNAVPDLIFPAMACRIRYFNINKKVKNLYGTIIGAEFTYVKTSNTQFNDEFRVHGELFVCVTDIEESKDEVEEFPSDIPDGLY